MRQTISFVIAEALLPEDGLNLLHGVLPGGVELKELPHHGGFGFVNKQPAVILYIAKQPTVAQNHAVLDGLLVTEFHAAGELPKLFLGNGGHNGQAQFRISFQCEDIVVLEKYAHTALQQLPRKPDGIQGVTGKPKDPRRCSPGHRSSSDSA